MSVSIEALDRAYPQGVLHDLPPHGPPETATLDALLISVNRSPLPLTSATWLQAAVQPTLTPRIRPRLGLPDAQALLNLDDYLNLHGLTRAVLHDWLPTAEPNDIIRLSRSLVHRNTTPLRLASDCCCVQDLTGALLWDATLRNDVEAIRQVVDPPEAQKNARGRQNILHRIYTCGMFAGSRVKRQKQRRSRMAAQRACFAQMSGPTFLKAYESLIPDAPLDLIGWATTNFTQNCLGDRTQTRGELGSRLAFAALCKSAYFGRLDLIQWFIQKNYNQYYKFDLTLIPAWAAAGGQLTVLEWFNDKHGRANFNTWGFDWWNQALQQAGSGGNQQVLLAMEEESRHRSGVAETRVHLQIAASFAEQSGHNDLRNFIAARLQSAIYNAPMPDSHVAMKFPRLTPNWE